MSNRGKRRNKTNKIDTGNPEINSHSDIVDTEICIVLRFVLEIGLLLSVMRLIFQLSEVIEIGQTRVFAPSRKWSQPKDDQTFYNSESNFKKTYRANNHEHYKFCEGI